MRLELETGDQYEYVVSECVESRDWRVRRQRLSERRNSNSNDSLADSESSNVTQTDKIQRKRMLDDACACVHAPTCMTCGAIGRVVELAAGSAHSKRRRPNSNLNSKCTLGAAIRIEAPSHAWRLEQIGTAPDAQKQLSQSAAPLERAEEVDLGLLCASKRKAEVRG